MTAAHYILGDVMERLEDDNPGLYYEDKSDCEEVGIKATGLLLLLLL